MTLFPKVGPAFLENPLEQRPTLSEAFTLSCTATGFPAPNFITWFRDGRVINSTFSNVNINTNTVNVYMMRSTLMINSARAEDSGNYHCVAESPRTVYSNVTSATAVITVLSEFLAPL